MTETSFSGTIEQNPDGSPRETTKAAETKPKETEKERRPQKLLRQKSQRKRRNRPLIRRLEVPADLRIQEAAPQEWRRPPERRLSLMRSSFGKSVCLRRNQPDQGSRLLWIYTGRVRPFRHLYRPQLQRPGCQRKGDSGKRGSAGRYAVLCQRKLY